VSDVVLTLLRLFCTISLLATGYWYIKVKAGGWFGSLCVLGVFE
jgi:hypothetical protein